MKKTPWLVAASYFLFAALFTVFGFVVIAYALTDVFYGNANWENSAPVGFVGFVFIVFGILIGCVGSRRAKRQVVEWEEKKAAEARPWDFRGDWKHGAVSCTEAKLRFVWFFAIFWSAVSVPALFWGWEEFVAKENPFALLALMFPAVGVGLLIWAVRLTLRHRKFGGAEFEMRSFPARPGGWVEGIVRVGRKIDPANGFDATLTCIRRMVCRSGRNHTVREKTLFQEEQVIERELDEFAADRTSVPLSFMLPDDVPPTDLAEPDNQVCWLLEVRASVFGINFTTSFDVPVFRVASGDVTVRSDLNLPGREGDDWAAGFRRRELPVDERDFASNGLIDSKIRIQHHAGGAKEFYFGPARNVIPAMGVTFFTALWTGIVWLLIHLGAPLFFAVVFGLFDVIFVLCALSMWTGTTTTLVDGSGIRIRGRLFGLGTTKSVSVSQVEDIGLDICMQSGRRPYYDIVVALKSGRKMRVGSAIRKKREAEWLVAEMKKSSSFGLVANVD